MNKQIRRSIVLSTIIAASCINFAWAQDERDALRFSMLQPLGTARSIGIGGTMGSVGGDFTSLSVNPAGIGVYRKSELMISPSVIVNNTSSDFLGNSMAEGGSHFSFSNIGLVTTKVESPRRAKRSGWNAISFGIGINRLADFTRNYSYEGRNTSSSGSFVFEYDANEFGLSADNISTPGDLGYEAFLIDRYRDSATGRNFFRSVVNPSDSTPVSQFRSVRERGGISELGLTIGGNYREQLMIGATLGIPIVRYIRTSTYEERDLTGIVDNDFDYFRYADDLKTTGAGINLKLGFIYKPVDNFRLGAAIHTPTYFSLSDVSNQSLTANTEGTVGTNTANASENQYDYNISTPWRALISGTALFGTNGFFTLDYEFVDYASARFKFGLSSAEKNYQEFINNTIRATYKSASNIRAGVEVRKENLMFRTGFGYYGNPYKSGSPDAQRLTFSAGFGIRFANTFIDIGYMRTQFKDSEQPYSLPNVAPYIGLAAPTAGLNSGANNVVFTLGFKM